MSVCLTGRRGLPRVDRRLLRRHAGAVLRAIDRTDSELSVALVDDAGIEELNLRYRGLPRATDVLSFSLLAGSHSERRGALLGDVVLSLETAARQARCGRRTLDDEVLRLLIHGVLHLVGYDHEEPSEARLMRAEERRVRRVVAP